MKHFTLHFGLLLMLFGLIACDSTNETKIEKETKIKTKTQVSLNETMEKEIVKADINTAITVFSKVAQTSSPKPNFMLSPYSFNVAMAMLLNGANGETKTEIETTLGYTSQLGQVLNEYYQKVGQTLIKVDPSTKLETFNSIWHRENYVLNSKFNKTMLDYYDTHIATVNFTDPNTKNIINQWCAEKTHNLIKEVVFKTKKSDVIYLINSLYFKANWAEQFEFQASDTQQNYFSLENGRKVLVEMMVQRPLKMPYFNNEFFEAVELPYGNGAFSMLVILPKAGLSVTKMSEELAKTGTFAELLNTSKNQKVRLWLPKFKINYRIELRETLELLGITKAFSLKADFSNVFEGNKQFNVDKINQVTYIDVNEKGTAAGAVTVVEGGDGAMPPDDEIEFAADRPFAFAIKEKNTGSILFIGKVGNPNKE